MLSTACLAHSTIHIYELAVPAMLILIQREFSAGDLSMARIVTVFGLLFGLGALPAGWLVDRIGAKALLLTCLWGSAASVLAMAFSPSLVSFGLAAAGMGTLLSIYHPAGTAMISQIQPNSGKLFAIHGMAGNLGVATAGAIAGGLGQWLGWRGGLVGLSALGFVLGLIVLSLPNPRYRDAASRRGGGRLQDFVLLLSATALMGMVYRGMTTFLPKLFAVAGGDEVTRGTALAGLLTTSTLIIGLAGMWIAGRLLDRGWAPASVFLLGAVMQFPFLVGIGWIYRGALLPLAMGVAFFHFMTQPAGNQLVARLVPPGLRGLGYGIFFFLNFGVGAAGAVLAGWASERFELHGLFPVLALLLVPCALLLLTLRTLMARVPGAPRSGDAPA